MTQKMSWQDQLRIAEIADSCPKTVRRYRRGQSIRPGSRRRIERAIRELGLERHLQPSKPAVDAA